MPLYESHAIILRNFKLNDADRIITFFTSRYGKIKAVAKGAVKPKGRFLGRLEPFIHCNMIAFGKEKADLLRLNSCDIINPFLAIRDNLNILSHAYVAVELVDCAQKERDLNREGYQLLMDALIAMSCESDDTRLNTLLRLFELKYISNIGFGPSLDICVSCSGKLSQGELGFNARKGGAICGRCLQTDPSAFRVSAGAVKLMGRSLLTPMDKVNKLAAGGRILSDIEKCVTEFIKTHIRREIRSELMLRL